MNRQLRKIQKELKAIRNLLEEKKRTKLINKVWKKVKKIYQDLESSDSDSASDSESESESESSDSESESDSESDSD
jgi:hypothetical protein